MDAANGKIVSDAEFAVSPIGAVSKAVYLAQDRDAANVTLDAQSSGAATFMPNRFTYAVDGGRLTIVCEVQRGSQWRMGDQLNCKRT